MLTKKCQHNKCLLQFLKICQMISKLPSLIPEKVMINFITLIQFLFDKRPFYLLLRNKIKCNTKCHRRYIKIISYVKDFICFIPLTYKITCTQPAWMHIFISQIAEAESLIMITTATNPLASETRYQAGFNFSETLVMSCTLFNCKHF